MRIGQMNANSIAETARRSAANADAAASTGPGSRREDRNAAHRPSFFSYGGMFSTSLVPEGGVVWLVAEDGRRVQKMDLLTIAGAAEHDPGWTEDGHRVGSLNVDVGT